MQFLSFCQSRQQSADFTDVTADIQQNCIAGAFFNCIEIKKKREQKRQKTWWNVWWIQMNDKGPVTEWGQAGRTAVDSKYTGHRRLGLTIVLLWSRHQAFYISKYHQGQHLTMHVWEAHTCMTNHWRPQNVCIQRKRISSSLPLALAAFSPQLIWEFLYNSSLSVYRSNMEWSGKPFRERGTKKKEKPLFL